MESILKLLVIFYLNGSLFVSGKKTPSSKLMPSFAEQIKIMTGIETKHNSNPKLLDSDKVISNSYNEGSIFRTDKNYFVLKMQIKASEENINAAENYFKSNQFEIKCDPNLCSAWGNKMAWEKLFETKLLMNKSDMSISTVDINSISLPAELSEHVEKLITFEATTEPEFATKSGNGRKLFQKTSFSSPNSNGWASLSIFNGNDCTGDAIKVIAYATDICYPLYSMEGEIVGSYKISCGTESFIQLMYSDEHCTQESFQSQETVSHTCTDFTYTSLYYYYVSDAASYRLTCSSAQGSSSSNYPLSAGVTYTVRQLYGDSSSSSSNSDSSSCSSSAPSAIYALKQGECFDHTENSLQSSVRYSSNVKYTYSGHGCFTRNLVYNDALPTSCSEIVNDGSGGEEGDGVWSSSGSWFGGFDAFDSSLMVSSSTEKDEEESLSEESAAAAPAQEVPPPTAAVTETLFPFSLLELLPWPEFLMPTATSQVELRSATTEEQFLSDPTSITAAAYYYSNNFDNEERSPFLASSDTMSSLDALFASMEQMLHLPSPLRQSKPAELRYWSPFQSVTDAEADADTEGEKWHGYLRGTRKLLRRAKNAPRNLLNGQQDEEVVGRTNRAEEEVEEEKAEVEEEMLHHRKGFTVDPAPQSQHPVHEEQEQEQQEQEDEVSVEDTEAWQAEGYYHNTDGNEDPAATYSAADSDGYYHIADGDSNFPAVVAIADETPDWTIADNRNPRYGTYTPYYFNYYNVVLFYGSYFDNYGGSYFNDYSGLYYAYYNYYNYHNINWDDLLPDRTPYYCYYYDCTSSATTTLPAYYSDAYGDDADDGDDVEGYDDNFYYYGGNGGEGDDSMNMYATDHEQEGEGEGGDSEVDDAADETNSETDTETESEGEAETGNGDGTVTDDDGEYAGHPVFNHLDDVYAANDDDNLYYNYTYYNYYAYFYYNYYSYYHYTDHFPYYDDYSTYTDYFYFYNTPRTEFYYNYYYFYTLYSTEDDTTETATDDGAAGDDYYSSQWVGMSPFTHEMYTTVTGVAMPTAAPTRSPSNAPSTRRPTATPTEKTTSVNQDVTISIAQTLNGISAADYVKYKSRNDRAFKSTIIAAVDVNYMYPSDITIVVVRDAATAVSADTAGRRAVRGAGSRSALSSLHPMLRGILASFLGIGDSCVVEYIISVNTKDCKFKNANEAVTTIMVNLATALDNGQFSEDLQAYADSYHATSMSSATSDSLTVSSASATVVAPDADSDGEANLDVTTLAAIIGIGVGVVCCLSSLVYVCVTWYGVHRSSDLRQTSAHFIPQRPSDLEFHMADAVVYDNAVRSQASNVSSISDDGGAGDSGRDDGIKPRTPVARYTPSRM